MITIRVGSCIEVIRHNFITSEMRKLTPGTHRFVFKSLTIENNLMNIHVQAMWHIRRILLKPSWTTLLLCLKLSNGSPFHCGLKVRSLYVALKVLHALTNSLSNQWLLGLHFPSLSPDPTLIQRRWHLLFLYYNTFHPRALDWLFPLSGTLFPEISMHTVISFRSLLKYCCIRISLIIVFKIVTLLPSNLSSVFHFSS